MKDNNFDYEDYDDYDEEFERAETSRIPLFVRYLAGCLCLLLLGGLLALGRNLLRRTNEPNGDDKLAISVTTIDDPDVTTDKNNATYTTLTINMDNMLTTVTSAAPEENGETAAPTEAQTTAAPTAPEVTTTAVMDIAGYRSTGVELLCKYDNFCRIRDHFISDYCDMSDTFEATVAKATDQTDEEGNPLIEYSTATYARYTMPEITSFGAINNLASSIFASEDSAGMLDKAWFMGSESPEKTIDITAGSDYCGYRYTEYNGKLYARCPLSGESWTTAESCRFLSEDPLLIISAADGEYHAAAIFNTYDYNSGSVVKEAREVVFVNQNGTWKMRSATTPFDYNIYTEQIALQG